MQDGHEATPPALRTPPCSLWTPNDVASSVVLDPVAVNDSIFWNTMSTERNLPAGLVGCGATLLFLTTEDPSRFLPRRWGVRTRSAGVSRSDASYSLLNCITFLVGVSPPASVVSFITISPGLTARRLSTRLPCKCGLCAIEAKTSVAIIMLCRFQTKPTKRP